MTITHRVSKVRIFNTENPFLTDIHLSSFSDDNSSCRGVGESLSSRGSARRGGEGGGVPGGSHPSPFIRSSSLGGPRVPGCLPPNSSIGAPGGPASGLESGFQSSSSLTSISGSQHNRYV